MHRNLKRNLMASQTIDNLEVECCGAAGAPCFWRGTLSIWQVHKTECASRRLDAILTATNQQSVTSSENVGDAEQLGEKVFGCLDAAPKSLADAEQRYRKLIGKLKSETYIYAYKQKKQMEYDISCKYDTKHVSEGERWYLLDAEWVRRWKEYVLQANDDVIDVTDIQSPGPIPNSHLLQKSAPIYHTDYVGINGQLWSFLVHCHGGGPPICREKLDMRSKECHPEAVVAIDELKDQEFSRRTSWMFVETCHGDMEKYIAYMNEGFSKTSNNATTSCFTCIQWLW